MNKIYLYLILISFPFWAHAQNGNVWEQRVYSPLVKTVLLSRINAELTVPVITLGSNEKLRIAFDELCEETKNYQYHLIHCNKDWTRSPLEPHEYLIGFETAPIEHHANSFNTLQRYVHYWQDFPNPMQEITQSGNYALIVTNSDNPDIPILVSHFMVLDPLVRPGIGVNPPQDPALKHTHHDLSVSLSLSPRLIVNNPEELTVYLFQNRRRDHMKQLKPRVVKPGFIEYSLQPENLFPGGNEFRSFDITSLRSRSRYVDNFDFINNETHVFLKPEINKQFRTHTDMGDLNGNYYIRSELTRNPDLESDYAWVHFTLPSSPRFDGAFYVVGALTDYKFNDLSRMNFNTKTNRYELSLYLKQGYYNYQILFQRFGELIGEEYPMEGNHFETQNEYMVLVYYRKPGNDYDSLIGFEKR